jgi:hypothetical protein
MLALAINDVLPPATPLNHAAAGLGVSLMAVFTARHFGRSLGGSEPGR